MNPVTFSLGRMSLCPHANRSVIKCSSLLVSVFWTSC